MSRGRPGQQVIEHRERARAREQARDAFIRAAAALMEPGDDALASAILFASMGIFKAAAADRDERAKDIAIKVLENERDRRLNKQKLDDGQEICESKSQS